MMFHAGMVFASIDMVPLIGVLGAITALGSALTVFFLYRHTSSDQIEQKKAQSALQYKTSMDSRLEKSTEKLIQPTESRSEKISKSRTLFTKQEPQFATPVDEEILARVQHAQLLDGYVNTYREGLLKDPVMTQLKILTMTWRLDLIQVYVRLRLHQGTVPDNIDKSKLRAEETRDPNLLLRADRDWLDRQAQEAIDPVDAIARYKHCVVLGDPGAGKTTLLKYIALRCANKELVGLSNLPIHVDLHLFVRSDEFRNYQFPDATNPNTQSCPDPLLTFAATEWNEHYDFPLEEARAYMQSNLETGNALLLLDGLDETYIGEDPVAAEETYERTVAIIRQLARTYSSAFIVITARTAGYRQRFPLHNFAELEVLDFRKQDIKQFLHNWYAYPPEHNPHFQPIPASEGKQTGGIPLLLENQLESPRIQALASKPLLLALIIITYQKEKKLPDKRADLYEACVNTLFEWDNDISRQPALLRFRQFNRQKKENLLKRIAWHFHKKGQCYFSESELMGVIEAYLQDQNWESTLKRNILDEITLESGLLKEQATDWYSFLHLTLQEYFTAIAAKEDSRKQDELLQHLEDPWWEEVILLYAGSCNDASGLLEELWQRGGYPYPSKSASYFHTNLILAGQCLAMHPSISNEKKSLRYDIVSCILRELNKPKPPYQLTRRQLAETLTEIADERTGPLSETPGNNYYPQNRLQRGNPVNEMVKDSILAMLTGEGGTTQAVQISLVRATGVFQHEEITQTLLDLLSNETFDVEVRIVIAQTLGISATPSMVETMIGILSRPIINLEVRRNIAEALSTLIDDTFVSDLIKLASNAQIDTGLRCAIVDTLGTAGRRLAIPGLQEVRDREKPGTPLHWHCAIALAKLGEFGYLDEVFTLLTNNNASSGGRFNIISIEVPRNIVIALGSLRLSSLVPKFISLLDNEQIPWEVRVSITAALEAINDASPSIIEDLIKLLSNRELNPFVRAAIGNLIGSLGDKRYIAPLQRVHIMEQEEPIVYRSVKTMLCRLGDTSILPELLNWIEYYSEKKIEPAECLNMLDALKKIPGRLSMAQCETLLRQVSNEKFDREMRQSIIALLPQLVYEKHESDFRKRVIKELYRILDNPPSDQQIPNEAHQALWAVRRYDQSMHTF